MEAPRRYLLHIANACLPTARRNWPGGEAAMRDYFGALAFWLIMLAQLGAVISAARRRQRYDWREKGSESQLESRRGGLR